MCEVFVNLKMQISYFHEKRFISWKFLATAYGMHRDLFQYYIMLTFTYLQMIVKEVI